MRLHAQLVPTDGYAIDALALSGDPGGIDLAVPWELAPDLREGQQLDLMLDAQVAALRTEVVVRQLRPEDDALEVRLTYADPDRVRLRMPGAVQEALRWCQDRYGRPARLQVQSPGGQWLGDILDLTATAGTTAVPSRHAPTVGDRLACRVDVPDGGRQSKLTGEVTQVWVDGPTARLTLRFTGSPKETDQLENRIQTWLTSRRNRRIHLAA